MIADSFREQLLYNNDKCIRSQKHSSCYLRCLHCSILLVWWHLSNLLPHHALILKNIKKKKQFPLLSTQESRFRIETAVKQKRSALAY